MIGWRWWAALALVAGCQRTTIVGYSSGCHLDGDCAPPDSICGADGQCVDGCAKDSTGCLGGSTCDATTGACTGGSVIGKGCASDKDCDAPAVVCRLAVGQCAAGCDLDPAECVAGTICDGATGHCCNPSDADCPTGSDAGAGCSSDAECAAQAGTVCVAGACVPSCAKSGCVAPKVCGATGHCGPPSGVCARDEECDDAGYCTQAGACAVAPHGGASGCAGGAIDRTSCNEFAKVDDFLACIGAPGPSDCAYCTDGACYHPGVCTTANDCHGGELCTGRLCRPSAPECPAPETPAAVLAGAFAAGHELCVADTVASQYDDYDGDVILTLSSKLQVVITLQYAASGVAVPKLGAHATFHGAVRWAAWYSRWEIHPVDWVGP